MYYTISLVLGIILLALSLVLFKDSVDFIKKSPKSIATVIGFEEVKKPNIFTFNSSYKTIYKFEIYPKQEIIYIDNVAASSPNRAIGEKAVIVYNPANPNIARILTYWGLFRSEIILMALAMPLIVMGGGYFAARIIFYILKP
jgi:hypothetical protein